MTTLELLKVTKAVWGSIRDASPEEKNRILLAMADALQQETDSILAANEQDMDKARGGISEVMLDRLSLDTARIDGMADGIRATVKLPDHTGRIISETVHANGMHICKKQVPLGLVAIIYESRPNVTSDAAALAIKSGNVCMLRSGKEAFNSCHAIVKALKKGIAAAGGNPNIVNIVEDTSRSSAEDIINGYRSIHSGGDGKHKRHEYSRRGRCFRSTDQGRAYWHRLCGAPEAAGKQQLL